MNRQLLLLTLALLPGADCAVARGTNEVPPAAREAGMLTETYSVDRFDASTVDMGRTRQPGFRLYNVNFFHGDDGGPPMKGVRLNSDGSITLGANGADASLSTMAVLGKSPARNMVGIAFGGGGYFEATIRFAHPDMHPDRPGAYQPRPAWWGMSAEHIAQRDDLQQWPGQPSGYTYFSEIDALEASDKSDYYVTNVFDHHGIYGKTCVPGYCDRHLPWNEVQTKVPAGTDWTKPHRFAARWIPATATKQGSITFYLDNVKVHETLYARWPGGNSSPPPEGQPWQYGVIDARHMAMWIDTRGGWPITVSSIRVFQTGTAGNITTLPAYREQARQVSRATAGGSAAG